MRSSRTTSCRTAPAPRSATSRPSTTRCRTRATAAVRAGGGSRTCTARRRARRSFALFRFLSLTHPVCSLYTHSLHDAAPALEIVRRRLRAARTRLSSGLGPSLESAGAGRASLSLVAGGRTRHEPVPLVVCLPLDSCHALYVPFQPGSLQKAPPRLAQLLLPHTAVAPPRSPAVAILSEQLLPGPFTQHLPPPSARRPPPPPLALRPQRCPPRQAAAAGGHSAPTSSTATG